VIYLDYNATTPVDPRVVAAMLPYFTEHYANPASKHLAGRRVAEQVEQARHQIATLLGTQRRNLVFTSGATEAAALAIRGLLAAADATRRRILVGATEHKAVLASAAATGCPVGVIRVHRDGTLDLDHLQALLGEDVALVAVMAANNETGVINDVAAAARLAHWSGALFCCDVTQAAGRIPVRLDDWEIDLAVASAHKLYGPKGIGVLVASRAVQRTLSPLLCGGGQERGLRAGTVHTSGVAGFGAAAQLAAAELADDGRRLLELTTLLHTELAARTPVEVHGHGAPRLPNTLSMRFPGVAADDLLMSASAVCAATGAACSSGTEEPSHVLLAMGIDPTAALQTVRFSLGRPTTRPDVLTAARLCADAVDWVQSVTAQDPDRPATPDLPVLTNEWVRT
jgi:cysteine desulfurase